MVNSYQSIRGMNDLLPTDCQHWQYVESALQHIVAQYGYQEIRLPMMENTEVFTRSIGEVTDIVEKEMYTFLDRNEESVTLRPEGTAGCVRAVIQNGMLHNQTQRLWYYGPMFRYERPQKGRYRQFYQIGVETFGYPGPDVDAELIFMSARFWRALNLQDISLQINSLGSQATRASYRDALVEYFSDRVESLDDDSKRRLRSNPLRILDSKNPELEEVIHSAPKLLDYLDPESKEHFDGLLQILHANHIDFTVNPRLVRGLDYYNRTVFEWVSHDLGSQGTVCAGGRYDDLVTQLGGKSTPAAGFAMGLERIVSLYLQQHSENLPEHPYAELYVLHQGDEILPVAFKLAELIRSELPQTRVLMHCGSGSFKGQFKRADKSGAQLAIVLGEQEISENNVGIKFLREEREQLILPLDELIAYLQAHLA